MFKNEEKIDGITSIILIGLSGIDKNEIITIDNIEDWIEDILKIYSINLNLSKNFSEAEKCKIVTYAFLNFETDEEIKKYMVEHMGTIVKLTNIETTARLLEWKKNYSGFESIDDIEQKFTI